MAIDFSVSYVNTGTAAVTGTAVTGIGTNWAGTVREGDLYGTHKGQGVRILTVTDDTHLVLAYSVAALAQANGPYEIQRTPYDIGYLEAMETLIALLGNGTLSSLSSLDGTGGDQLPYFNGANSLALTTFAQAARSLLGLTAAADRAPYFTSGTAAALFTLTAAGRALLDDANASAQLTTLGFSTFVKTTVNAADAAAFRTAIGATGDVTGPASAVDNRLAQFNGITGKILEDSGKLAPAGDIIGTTDTQTLTNKTLTQPILILEQGTSVAPTAEGRITWDTDDNLLKIGDGATTKTFAPIEAGTTTPAVTSSVGTLGSGNSAAISYVAIGNLVVCTGSITIGAAGLGSGSGELVTQLPFMPASRSIGVAREVAATGVQGVVTINPGSLAMSLVKYDGLGFIANSRTFYFSVSYFR